MCVNTYCVYKCVLDVNVRECVSVCVMLVCAAVGVSQF